MSQYEAARTARPTRAASGSLPGRTRRRDPCPWSAAPAGGAVVERQELLRARIGSIVSGSRPSRTSAARPSGSTVGTAVRRPVVVGTIHRRVRRRRETRREQLHQSRLFRVRSEQGVQERDRALLRYQWCQRCGDRLRPPFDRPLRAMPAPSGTPPAPRHTHPRALSRDSEGEPRDTAVVERGDRTVDRAGPWCFVRFGGLARERASGCFRNHSSNPRARVSPAAGSRA